MQNAEIPADADLEKQTELLERILKGSPVIWEILTKVPELSLPNWYLAGGCIFQTVWNHLCGLEPVHGIKDADLVYFDEDLSGEKESDFAKRGQKLFEALPLEVETVNQARVHLWFKKDFGYDCPAFTSAEQSISTWGTTAQCIGVRREKLGKLVVCAPYGLRDMLTLTVRLNIGSYISRENVEKKIKRWQQHWPNLTVARGD